MLAEPWRTITLFNPVVYLINGFRWTFFGTAEVPVVWSMLATLAFLLACLGGITWIFQNGLPAEELNSAAARVDQPSWLARV